MTDSRHIRALAPTLRLTAIAAAVVFGSSGCGSHTDETARDGRGRRDTIEVAAVVVGVATEGASVSVPGRVRAREEITLTARLAARLTALPVREGHAFRRGDILARFDAPEARDAVRSSQEALAASEIRARQARSDEARARKLHDQGVLAQRDVELAQVAAHTAEAALAQARAGAREWTENTSLPAPFDGIVARRHVDPGQTVAPGQPLLDLRSIEVGEIEAAIPESALPLLERAHARFQVGDAPWREAELLRVDGMTDPLTRTRRAHFRPVRREGLEPGAYARVELTPREGIVATTPGAGEPPAPIVLPDSVLVRRGALTGVYVLRDGRAWLRWLRVGRDLPGGIEVLSGLFPGERVAATPGELSDQRPVRVRP